MVTSGNGIILYHQYFQPIGEFFKEEILWKAFLAHPLQKKRQNTIKAATFFIMRNFLRCSKYNIFSNSVTAR